MRQTGIFAACGLVALQDWQEQLRSDHDNAAFLAQELAGIPGIQIEPELVETNILRFTVEPKPRKRGGVDYRKFVGRLREEHQVLCNAGFANDNVRFVTHRDVSREHCEKALKAVKSLI